MGLSQTHSCQSVIIDISANNSLSESNGAGDKTQRATWRIEADEQAGNQTRVFLQQQELEDADEIKAKEEFEKETDDFFEL